MRKTISRLFLVMAMVFSLFLCVGETAEAATSHSGTIYGVKWTIDTKGVLTVEPGERYETNWGTVYESGDMGDSMQYDTTFFNYAEEITKIVVKDGIKKIPGYTFRNLYNATEVEIASSVEEIGTYAFAWCEKLESLTLHEGVKKIGIYAFSSCGFKEITLPAGMEELEDYIFEMNYQLEKVTFADGAEEIPRYMFTNCASLTEVVIPDSIKVVEWGAFDNTALYNTAEASGEDFIIYDKLLLGCNVDCFEYDTPCVIPEGVVCIADSALAEVQINGTLELPESLRYIGSLAFDGGHYNYINCLKYCTSLDLKNVEYIGNSAFRYWYNLKEVDLSNVKHLGERAFYWCKNLGSAKMAKHMDYIGGSIFSTSGAGTSLGKVKVTQAPQTADYVHSQSFSNTQIMEAAYDGVEDGYYYCNDMLLYIDPSGDFTNGILVADGTYAIANEIYLYDTSATSITIPESVKSIGALVYDYDILTDVYYAGDQAGWDSIAKRETFQYATVHCAKKSAVSLNDCTVKLGYTTTAYTGKVKKPSVTVTDKDGNKLTKNTDYKVIYSNNKNAGTAKVTVIGKGDYCDTVEKTFKITKVKAANITAKLSYQKAVYNGKQKTPSVIAADKNGNTLAKATDFTITFNKTTRKSVGRYKATVTFKGNYTGTKTFWFTIVPDVPSTLVAALVSGTGGYDDIVVKWDSVTGASGYNLYYKKAGETSWSKAIDCGKTRTYTMKDLVDGTKYSFKVVPYYKASTGVKYLSTKSIIKSAYTLKKVPDLAVSKYSSKKVKLTWKDVDGETGYQIQRMTVKNGKYVVQQPYTREKNTVSMTIAPKQGVKYYYRVRAYKTESYGGKTYTVYGPWSTVKPWKLVN